jgi:orotate phosphoribosyltransferase-like protein
LDNGVKIELALLASQALSSYLGTRKTFSLIGSSASGYVASAALSDAMKLTVVSGVAATVIGGTWTGIAVAVLGGMLGNALAHFQARKKKQSAKSVEGLFCS